MEWTDKKERMPDESETDAQKCVLGWHELFGCMTVNVHELTNNLFVTHWMPLPKGPKGQEPTNAPAYRPGPKWQNKKQEQVPLQSPCSYGDTVSRAKSL